MFITTGWNTKPRGLDNLGHSVSYIFYIKVVQIKGLLVGYPEEIFFLLVNMPHPGLPDLFSAQGQVWTVVQHFLVDVFDIRVIIGSPNAVFLCIDKTNRLRKVIFRPDITVPLPES